MIIYIYTYIILHLSLFSLRGLAGFDCRPTNLTRESWAAQCLVELLGELRPLPPLPTLRPLPLQRCAARYCVIIGDNEEGQVDNGLSGLSGHWAREELAATNMEFCILYNIIYLIQLFSSSKSVECGWSTWIDMDYPCLDQSANICQTASWDLWLEHFMGIHHNESNIDYQQYPLVN